MAVGRMKMPVRGALFLSLMIYAMGLTTAAGDERRAGEEITAWLPGGEGMQFVWIPPGKLTAGTTGEQEAKLRSLGLWSGEFANEQPAHEWEIGEGFYLGKYEVTQQQWVSVMGTRPWQGYVAGQESSAAVCLSWDLVRELVARLNGAMGEELYRLPTEREWEYACRAGSRTLWSFGDDPDSLAEYAWYQENAWDRGIRGPLPVGLKRANAWGLHDMYGNAWEWCRDRPSPYRETGFVGPVRPFGGDYRIIRGGSFNSIRYVRSAVRGTAVPSNRYNVLFGARLVRKDSYAQP